MSRLIGFAADGKRNADAGGKCGGYGKETAAR